MAPSGSARIAAPRMHIALTTVALSPRSAGFANRMRDKHVQRNRNVGRSRCARDHPKRIPERRVRAVLPQKHGGPGALIGPCIAPRKWALMCAARSIPQVNAAGALGA
jgi:hypothetical protein